MLREIWSNPDNLVTITVPCRCHDDELRPTKGFFPPTRDTGFCGLMFGSDSLIETWRMRAGVVDW